MFNRDLHTNKILKWIFKEYIKKERLLKTDKYKGTDSYLIVKFIEMKDSIQMHEPCDPCKLTPILGK